MYNIQIWGYKKITKILAEDITACTVLTIPILDKWVDHVNGEYVEICNKLQQKWNDWLYKRAQNLTWSNHQSIWKANVSMKNSSYGFLWRHLAVLVSQEDECHLQNSVHSVVQGTSIMFPWWFQWTNLEKFHFGIHVQCNRNTENAVTGETEVTRKTGSDSI